MIATLTSPPAGEPVDLIAAKKHLRIDTSDDDEAIAEMIVAAREQAEFLTGQRLVTQTWTVVTGGAGELSLYGLTPVQSITAQGTSFSVNADSPPTITVDGPATLAIVCGFGAPAGVPASLKRWMLLRIGALYEQREGISLGVQVTNTPHSFADSLLDPYRLPRC